MKGQSGKTVPTLNIGKEAISRRKMFVVGWISKWWR